MAQRDKLNVHWLLTGAGSPGARPLVEQLREALVTELSRSTGWPRRRLETYMPDPPTLWRCARRTPPRIKRHDEPYPGRTPPAPAHRGPGERQDHRPP